MRKDLHKIGICSNIGLNFGVTSERPKKDFMEDKEAENERESELNSYDETEYLRRRDEQDELIKYAQMLMNNGTN